MVQQQEVLITTVEGPKGKADIYEVTLPNTGKTIEVEYRVVAGSQTQGFPALGAAHIWASEQVGEPGFGMRA